MRTRRVLIAAIVATLVFVAGAAATALPLRFSPYVRLVAIRGGVTVKLTAAGRRLLAPRQLRGGALTSDCTHLIATPQGDVPGQMSGAVEGRTDKHGHTVAITVLDTHADFCSISLDHPQHANELGASSSPPFTSIAFTRRGAIFLDEDRVARDLLATLEVAQELARRQSGDYPAPAAFAAFDHPGVVALAAPTDTPPAGAIGYYSDGGHHATIVGVAALGQRLYVDDNGDVFSTNAAPHVFRAGAGA